MKIQHDRKKKRFSAKLGLYEASLMYAQKGKVLDFYHIYVPDPFRNRQVAGRILMAAFEYAKKEKLKVVPTCPFIAGDFLSRFPRYKRLTLKGEFPLV